MSTDTQQLPSTPSGKIAAGRHQRRLALLLLSKYGTLIGMLAMIVIFSAAAPASFPTLSNFVNIFNQASLVAIISGGLTVALIAGEMDLSVGYVASLAGVLVTGLMVDQHIAVPLAILAVLLVGAGIGLVNGLIVTKARVNAVIATLGTGTIVVGLNYAYSTGVPIASGVPEAFLNIALGKVFGIPDDIVIMLALLALLWLILNRTDLGQQIQAVGGNVEAARLSGIRVDQVKITAFMITGICAALTGLLLSSLIGSGTIGAADSYLLNAFAAVFLGSATLKDGEFHIPGTLIGVLIIGIGFNGLAIFGVPTFYQYVFQGVILVVAVGLSTVARRFSKA
jgi:ribose transport system permease protein